MMKARSVSQLRGFWIDCMAKQQAKKSYSAKDIYVLEGLEPVRKRPGMYIGTTDPEGLHHLVWEVIDNSIDEAMGGYAKNISVSLLQDGWVRVVDDGRGIPVEKHAQTKKSALETVMTTLHAGGKFGGESYKVSGGLHGVGVSVVNALSRELRVEVCWNDGVRYAQEYKRGVPQGPVKKVGKCAETGTTVTFLPDSEIFTSIVFDAKKITNHLRQQAYLTKGVRMEISDERGEVPLLYGFYFDGGLAAYLDYLAPGRRVQDTPFYVHTTHAETDVEVETAFIYTDDVENEEMAFANNIYTPDGGMHLTGFRSALTRTLNEYARREGYVKDDDNLTGDDVREGLVAAISVKLREPQFEGQTKARLGSPEARRAVEAVVNETLMEFLETHTPEARGIIDKNILAAKARKAAKAAKDTVLRKGALEGLSLPGKLADCVTRRPEEAELFIVEGDSAGGCFSGDTLVSLADGREVSFEQLVKEDVAGKQNYCYTTREDGSLDIAQIHNPRVTRHSVRVVRVVLNDDKEITCTPDHLFRLRDGLYKRADELTPNDSLMPLRRKASVKGGNIPIHGYEMVYDPPTNRWIFTHLLSDRYNRERGLYRKDDRTHIHHKDFNKLNNNPDNVVRIPMGEHLALHRHMAEKTLRRPDVLAKLRVLHRTVAFRARIREAMLQPAMHQMLSERAKKQWTDPAYKAHMTERFLRFYRSHAEYRRQNNELLDNTQKAYWSEPAHRERQAERVRKHFEGHPEKRGELSRLAKAQWDNLVLRAWRAEKTKEQWTHTFRVKRREAYDRTYRDKALKALHEIYRTQGIVDVLAYDKVRRLTRDKSLIRFDTVCQRFFGGNMEKLEEAVVNYNHRVKRVVPLTERMDVYDLEVESTHNFALASGVFVHNSAKSGRDRRTQAILPLRGKILNVEKTRVDRMLKNNEIKALIIALGTAIAESFDITKLRYHKVIILSDADVDGAHIRTLLLTLFFRYFPQIIDGGYLYIAQPPLFRAQKGKKVEYAYTDQGLKTLLREIGEDASIQRYKGLGEMNPSQLWETTMDPGARVLKRVTVKDAEEADKMFDMLMGEEVEPRKHFIQARASSVKNLDV